ncbi:MAG: hypothetical protein LBP55_02790 [Candidatus Adiutrix sp.]|jgi:23S rRNA (uracil1939-C5)-methyltransferase|nr:hypothetical protein [Candidatus Adiutrix sp.]
MKPFVELEVEKLIPGGLGLARRQGEAILLAGVLPGEKALVELEGRVRGARRGRVERILEPAPLRITPDCPLYGRCGGCDFIHIDPAAAHRLKSEAALGDLAGRAGVALELVESPRRERYRARATLHLGRDERGRPAVGFHDHGRRVVEAEDCRLLAPELLPLVTRLRAWAAELPPAAAGAEISLARGEDGGLMVSLSPAPGLPWAALEQLPDLLAGLAPNPAILARPRANSPLWRLSGPARLTAAVWPEWSLTLRAAPGGFTQINPAVNYLMVRQILALGGPARPGDQALDLYSGLGNIALPLLKSGWAVTAVEESAVGAAAARENGRRLAALTLSRGRSEKVGAGLVKNGRTFGLVVLDPPRAGAPNLAPALAALRPRRIIYLACHPAVLHRDLPALASLGYGLTRLLALDMFPRTSHLEALALLER